MIKIKKFIHRNLFLILSCLILLGLGHFYGTRYYIAWPDETLFTDIARSFANGGPLGAPSYAGNGMGVDEKTYFMPPLYPVSLALWYKIAPSTLLSARVFSNIIALFCIGAIFWLLRLFGRSAGIAGLATLALVFNIEFAFMYNWARPDILALAFSLLAVLVYSWGLNKDPDDFDKYLAGGWILATLGMLTHPIGGLIGFAAIPLHMLRARFQKFGKLRTWLILLVIPLIGLCLWGIYILQDWNNFYYQMFEWQAARKAGRISGVYSILQLLWKTISNYGILGGGWKGIISSILLLFLVGKAILEKDRRRPAFLAMLLVLISNFVVVFGYEMPYPPLRLAPFYFGLALLIEPTATDWIKKTLPFSRKVLDTAPAVLAGGTLIFLLITSIFSSVKLVYEVRYSERALAYDPNTLATQVVQLTEPGSSIGIRIYPEALDILENSGHFSNIRKLAGAHLSHEAFLQWITSNDYLAITDTVLEPHYPGALNDYTPDIWGGTIYRTMASQYYVEKARIILPNGGLTILYQRDLSKRVDSSAP